MLLRKRHPEVAFRDCDDCQKHVYDEETGLVKLWRDQPRLRIVGVEKPLCRTPKGCPKGTPENPRTLSPQNWLCYKHYQRCAAIGRFPDDPLVAEHAAIIQEAEREAWEQNQLDAIRSMLPVLSNQPYGAPQY